MSEENEAYQMIKDVMETVLRKYGMKVDLVSIGWIDLTTACKSRRQGLAVKDIDVSLRFINDGE